MIHSIDSIGANIAKDIMKVKGIGKKTFEKIKDDINVMDDVN